MRVSEWVSCQAFPCTDVRHACYVIPDVDVEPNRVSILLISEAAPADPADHYYAAGDPLFARTTVQAFKDAGAEVTSIGDILKLGIYLTTAVKCGKTGYAIDKASITECSRLLEQEIALFPNVVAFLLMGDVAIQAVNAIAKRSGQPRVIPVGPHVQDPGAGEHGHAPAVHIPRGQSLPIVPPGRAELLHREEQAPDDRRGHRDRAAVGALRGEA